MPKILDPLRDPQRDQITGYCPRCGGEYYHDESGLCETRKEETTHYGSKDLSDTISDTAENAKTAALSVEAANHHMSYGAYMAAKRMGRI